MVKTILDIKKQGYINLRDISNLLNINYIVLLRCFVKNFYLNLNIIKKPYIYQNKNKVFKFWEDSLETLEDFKKLVAYCKENKKELNYKLKLLKLKKEDDLNVEGIKLL